MKGSENVTFAYGNSKASTSKVASTSKTKLVLIDEDGGLKAADQAMGPGHRLVREDLLPHLPGPCIIADVECGTIAA